MITKAIEKAFAIVKARGWETSYWAIDVHDTIVKANYKYGSIPKEFYPRAKEVLRQLSERSDIEIILFTSSHPDEVVKYMEFFEENGIHFKFSNENPEIKNISYGCYDRKFYFNVLIDDKAGFDPDQDWIKIEEVLKKYPEHSWRTTN